MQKSSLSVQLLKLEKIARKSNLKKALEKEEKLVDIKHRSGMKIL